MRPCLYFATMVLVFSAATSLHAKDPASPDGLEVLAVKPSNRIRHGVEARGTLGEERGFLRLSGPSHFSRPARTMEGEAKGDQVFQTWYEIVNAKSEPERIVQILVPSLENRVQQITLGQPKYLLSPAQQVTSGAPAPVPAWLGLFKAYEIESVKPVEQRGAVVADAEELQNLNLQQPVLLCVPAEQWHHEEHTPIADKNRAFIAYAADSQVRQGDVSAIDQFGLNRLSVQARHLRCFPVVIR